MIHIINELRFTENHTDTTSRDSRVSSSRTSKIEEHTMKTMQL